MSITKSTITTYEYNNDTRELLIPFDYLRRDFIKVFLDGGGKPKKILNINVDYKFNTKTTIGLLRVFVPSEGYNKITIQRVTDASKRIVNFQDGSVLNASELNISQLQALHVAEEARDLSSYTLFLDSEGNLDARGRRIVNLGDPTEKSSDAVNVKLLEETGDSILIMRDQISEALSVALDKGYVSNISALRLIEPTIDKLTIEVKAYYEGGTVGGGTFIYDASDLVTPDNGGTVLVTSKGKRWKRCFTYLSLEDFGAKGNGTSDDTISVKNAFNSGFDINLNGGTYLCSPFTIKNKLSLRGKGTLRIKTPSESMSSAYLTVNAPFNAEYLCITSKGVGDDIFNMVEFISDNIEIDTLELNSEAPRQGTGGCVFRGSNIKIKSFKSKNIARPLAFEPKTPSVKRSNIQVGSVLIDNYIRGVKFNYCDNWSIDSIITKTRWENVGATQGYNGVLIEVCENFKVGSLLIQDAAEHAIRIGGAGNTKNFIFGDIMVINSGGSALKLNVENGFLSSEGSFGKVVGINIGEGSALGNKEVVRLTKIHNVTINSIEAYKSCTRVLSLADIENLTINSIYGEGIKARLIEFMQDQDGASGPIKGLYINNCVAYLEKSARNGISMNYTRPVSNVFINNCFLSGFNKYAVSTTGINVQGVIYMEVSCKPDGLPPLFENPSNDPKFIVSLKQGLKEYKGALNRADMSGDITFNGNSFELSSTSTNKGTLMLNSKSKPSALNGFGPSVSFGRLDSTRRGAAIAAMQTGSAPNNVGLALCVSSGVSVSSEVLEPTLVVKHSGTINIKSLPKTTNGLASGDLWNDNGTLKIVS